ncbi:G2-specific serine/threonine protein kinase [Tulasnella sp. JGI-2019a]|nr:G2-specific serine/threonine protein kinase [Tulasnella sp. JGI-2019a]KAG9012749.1 G2-specific serine/threonine protein kinase [Tulasnella sp. JGI-2019a]
MSQQQPSEFLAQYEVLDVIGNGMFGVIKKVRNKVTGEILARKDLNFDKMTDKDRKQIVAEVNILKDLSHQHIVRYHDRYVDRENGYLYILMEYCGGGDLSRELLKHKKHSQAIPEQQIWQYFYQLLLALQHCHHPGAPGSSPRASSSVAVGEAPASPTRRTHQVLHRDIKPENVFLSEKGEVKLGDFGLSKQMTATFASTYVGTPYYMSPEMLKESSYDAKSDVWSLGCLVFELCALQPPFYAAKTQQELTSLIRSGRIPLLPPGYSAELYKIIKEMLSLNPGSRPSVQQLLAHNRFTTISEQMETHKLMLESRAIRDRNAAAEAQIKLKQEALERAWEQYNQNVAATRDDFNRERSTTNELRRQIEEERLRLANERAALIEEQNRLQMERNKLMSEAHEFGREKQASTAALNAEMRCYEQNKQAMEKAMVESAAKYAAFEREKAEFEKEKERWGMEREQRQDGPMRGKKPLEEIQAQKSTIPLPSSNSSRYSFDDPSSKGVPHPRQARAGSQDQNIPPSNVPAIQQPRYDTPANRVKGGKRLASRSNPNLGSAMKGVVLTTTGVQLETPAPGQLHHGDDEVAPPIPSVLKQILQDSVMDSPDSARQSSSSENDSPRTRIRRRSTISSVASGTSTASAVPRPVPTHANTAPPTNIPTWCAPATAPATYDLSDEANLPSPFIKKSLNVVDGVPANARVSWGAVKAGLKKGPGLLGLATANSAATANTGASGKGSGIPTGPTASSSKGSRSSYAKTLKASEDAQKAYNRRVAAAASGVHS